MHWIDRMNAITLKLAKLNKAITANDIFTASACVINDYECTKKILAIPDKDWEKLLKALHAANKKDTANKIEILLCYINELRRLASVNIRELIDLTREDVVTMQRICVTKKDATQPARKLKTIEILTDLLNDAAEADENNKYLNEKYNNTPKAMESY